MTNSTLTQQPRPSQANETGEQPHVDQLRRTKPQSALVMRPPLLAEMLFGKDLGALLEYVDLPYSEIFESVTEIPNPERIDLLITGWGAPAMSSDSLAELVNLKAIVHAGGNAAYMLPNNLDHRTPLLSNAGDANAIPVAEYTLAMIILANKSSFSAARLYQTRQEFIDRETYFPEAGNFGKTVGVIGASRTGRLVLRLLANHDLNVAVYDPTLTAEQITALGGSKMELTELMRASDVVTIHAPENPATEGMIGAEELSAMRQGATLINTSRGSLVDQDALVSQLQSGRINAILDVADPDVLPENHPLYTLRNVVLTPHIAGSMGREIRRLGNHVLAEVGRYSSGLPFEFPEYTS